MRQKNDFTGNRVGNGNLMHVLLYGLFFVHNIFRAVQVSNFWFSYFPKSTKISHITVFTRHNSRILPYYGMMTPSSLASKPTHLHPIFTLLCVKYTRDSSELHSRPERRASSFRSKVVFLSLYVPALFLSFYMSSSNLKLIFFCIFLP